ncbi:MAG: FkbM family methyltransferase [Acidobacteriota bacterium]
MRAESRLHADPVEETRTLTRSDGAINGRVKRGLKRLRALRPFNQVATSTVHALFSAMGRRSEFIIKHLHRVGDVRLALPNNRTLRLWSRGDDWVSNQVYWRGWDGYSLKRCLSLLSPRSMRTGNLRCFAYVGLFTLLTAHANPDGRVYAFEPLPGVYERLRKNVALNRLDRVQCIKSAVGEIDGAAEFFHVPVELPTSSSPSYEFMCSANNLTVSTVPIITLDRFVEQNKIDRVDLVKIDTESTEPQVLRGMIKALRRDRPFIVCEVLGRGSERELEEALRPIGYRYYHLTPDGPVFRERIEGHPEWLNYLFTILSPDEVAGL